jgi:hypothetical protein
MAQLDERTHRDLARIRDRGAPSEAARQRMFAVLEAQLGPDGGGEDDGSGADPGWELVGDGGASSLGWAAKVVGATVGLAAGGLVAIRVGAELVRVLAAAPELEPSREHAPAQPVVIASALAPDEREAAEPEAAPVELAPPAKRRSVAVPNEPPLAREDTLAAELALLEAAHATGDPGAALVELERHLERFPHGELADERELLRVQTLCRLDRLADARTLAERFLLEHPSSALRRRLASACPALDDQQKN